MGNQTNEKNQDQQSHDPDCPPVRFVGCPEGTSPLDWLNYGGGGRSRTKWNKQPVGRSKGARSPRDA